MGGVDREIRSAGMTAPARSRQIQIKKTALFDVAPLHQIAPLQPLSHICVLVVAKIYKQ
jgi:hypothetical protein